MNDTFQNRLQALVKAGWWTLVDRRSIYCLSMDCLPLTYVFAAFMAPRTVGQWC